LPADDIDLTTRSARKFAVSEKSCANLRKLPFKTSLAIDVIPLKKGLYFNCLKKRFLSKNQTGPLMLAARTRSEEMHETAEFA
jgi:hypothetical protein